MLIGGRDSGYPGPLIRQDGKDGISGDLPLSASRRTLLYGDAKVTGRDGSATRSSYSVIRLTDTCLLLQFSS